MVKIEKISSRQVKNIVCEEYHISYLSNGFGNTIGNSLRRIILSFTPGIDIFGIQISCFKHEFDSNNILLEDANLIIERFKNVMIYYNPEFTDDVVKIQIKIDGPKEFKAGDIKIDNLKIINSDFVLFNVVKEEQIDLNIFIKRGLGFTTCKDNGNSFDDNSILGVTSIYSRINKVTYKLIDKNTSFRDCDEIILNIEHEAIYPVGFILKTALTTLRDTVDNIMDAYNKYQLSAVNSLEVRISILNLIEENYGKDAANFFNSQEFMSYAELDALLSKLTYKKCKMTKDGLHELCRLIKEKVKEA